MKFILIVGLLAGTVLNGLAGDWTGQRIGNFDYWTGPNGARFTGQRIGDFYYLNGNDAYGHSHSYTGQRIGDFFYWNGN